MRGRVILAGLAVAGLAVASSAQAPSTPTPVAEYWLRVYPMPAYGEIWRLTLSVADFKKALPKAIEILNKRGDSVLPLENMAGSEKGGFQQLSYRFPAEAAPKALAALQKLGDVEELQKNPGVSPAVQGEVREKLAKLKSERDANAKALANIPTIGAAVAEIISHLETVERANTDAAGRVLLNVQLRQRPSPAAKH